MRAEARHALLDEKAADALVGLRPHDGDVGDAAVGDPALDAGDDELIAVGAGAGLHAARIGAVIRFGQAEAADEPCPQPCAGSQRSFCASEPKAWIGCMHSEPCTDTIERKPLSPRSSSWQMSP